MWRFYAGPVLAIESSCDETSAAILEGQEVRANIVSSQIEMHQKWGGVVPEAAARAHVEAILPVIDEALSTSGTKLQDLAAICVTNRPGLVGALSVGVTAARTLGFALGIPVIGVHHLEGHLLSPLGVLSGTKEQTLEPPFLSLIVSGGHTELVRVSGLGDYEIVAQTLDDAAGEAFDKTARLLGLGYPGGKAVQDAARLGDVRRYALPRGAARDAGAFSFSGLKTAVLRLVEKEGAEISVPDAAASVQEAIVDALSKKAETALETYHDCRTLALAGGVAANLALRERLASVCARGGRHFVPAHLDLCTDNAAMIGIAGSLRLAAGSASEDPWDVLPNAPLPSLSL